MIPGLEAAALAAVFDEFAVASAYATGGIFVQDFASGRQPHPGEVNFGANIAQTMNNTVKTGVSI